MGGLGEEVEEVEFGQGVAGRSGEGGEGLKIRGEGFRRAGDVDQSGRGNAGEKGTDLGACSGAGRVEDDEIGAVALEDGDAEEVERSGFDCVEVGDLGGGERGGGGFGDLYGGDLGESGGKGTGEEADSCVEIEG